MQRSIPLGLHFGLQATRERLLPLLNERFESNRPIICRPDEDTFCCSHPITVNFPSRNIINEMSLYQLRVYATLAAHANTTCADFEILQACHNIGLLFKVTDFHIWKELFHLGQADNTIFLEHAVCGATQSVHQAFTGVDQFGIDFVIYHENTKK